MGVALARGGIWPKARAKAPIRAAACITVLDGLISGCWEIR